MKSRLDDEMSTYKIQSMANNRDKLPGSTSMEPIITNSITNDADGMAGIAIDRAVDVMQTMNNESKPSVTPFKWAMKQVAIDINSAVPGRGKYQKIE